MSTQPETPTRRPNMVFLLTDDHAAHAIGAYGSVVNTTPRIDEIAESGARLEHCYATNSLCTPSRASILTGTYSHVNGVYGLKTHIDASQPTFISRLREEGYRTAIVGKWHMGDGETDGVSHDPQDFDYWDVVLGQGEYHDPRFRSADGERTEEGYATNVITDLSLQWMDAQVADDEDRPWAILIWHKAPHRPWQPDPAHLDLYTDPIAVPRTFFDDYSTRTASARRAAMRLAEGMHLRDLKTLPPEGLTYEELSLWKYQRYMEDYLRCVHSVDVNVGRVLDWLKERDLFDDTLVAYSSDQGFFLGDHGWYDKRFMYEESLKMPFVVSYPRRIPAGTVYEGTASNVDMAQTFLDAAGVAHHPRMQGRSFFGDLVGEPTAPQADGLYYRYWENDDYDHHAPAHYGWRTERYKLIYFYNDGLGLPGTTNRQYPPEWELYDMEQDPDEVNNVYDDPAYREVREELKVAMWKAQESFGDAPHPSQPVPTGLTVDA
ncbi:sulfatase family protein [Phycicoccus flavus]|uniref:sulfatase family protein n=1 Tax=Phycicoccus flavus TaxID=2502783 RepID=UPI000FEB5DF3|nr:sulfatase [Phycicoccus flavus]NHA67170.1 sulfatase [Phycicoccus flavus]